MSLSAQVSFKLLTKCIALVKYNANICICQDSCLKQDKPKTNKVMKKEKTKAKAAKIGITGSAQYMRELVKKGTAKADAFKKVLAKWPQFENDKAGLASRWDMANKILKTEAAKKAA